MASPSSSSTSSSSSRSGLCNIISVFVIIIIIVNAATTIMAAEEFKVGDDLGWRKPSANETDMYNLWASRRRFHVGDSLRFKYKNDSVVVVDKWGYYHCNISNQAITYGDGNNNTLINLDKPGPVYIVSGDSGHCKDGQRLLIEVLPLRPSSHPPPPPSPISDSGGTVSSVGRVVLVSSVVSGLLMILLIVA